MGTASARPDKLQAFVTAAGEIRSELQGRINQLRASYDSFQRSGSAGVANPDLMDVELPNFITNWSNDETFVAVVRQAFIDADPSYGQTGGLAEVGSARFDTAFRAAATRAGIDPDALLALRSPVTVNDPVAAGIPHTSGFVNDPVCTATGHFVEAEEDFTWPDRLAVLRWQRTYSSRFVAGGPFGRGWASWATVACLVQDDGSVAYNGPDGQMAVFLRTDDGYGRVAGVAATLVRLEDGAAWELRWDMHSGHPGEVWRFSEDGHLRTVAAPTLGTTRFVYEGGLLVAVVHDGGRRLDIEWDGPRIRAVRSSCGRSARYHYDDAGDLVRTERVLGERRYVVDEQGRIVELWDADGVRLCHNTYDHDGRVVTQVSPFGRETVFRYEPGRRTVVSDTTDGPVNVYEHDEAGRLVAVTDDLGHRMERRFDVRGRCVEATGFDGADTRQFFDPDGRTAERVGPDGATERWEYDEHHRVVAHQVGNGPRLGLEYHGDDLFPVRLEGPLGWEMHVEIVDGLVRSLTDADGVQARFEHDADGNVVAQANALGAITRTVPHVSGEAAQVTLPDGAIIECERDDAGRLLTMRSPVGDEFRIEWSPAGRLTALVEPTGARTTFEHGSHGGLERLVDALGSAIEIQTDQLERLVGLSAPGGAKWGFTYTALGLLSLVQDPTGATWSYEYDAEGRMVSATDPLGHEVRQSYDRAGRPTEVVDQSGNATRFSRDAFGRVVAEEAPEGAVTAYEWDEWGRPTAVRQPDGNASFYEYTAAGRVRAVRSAEGRGWRGDYDAAGRLVTMTDATGAVTRFEWDVCDRMTAVVSPSGRVVRFAYDGAGRVIESERGGQRWRASYDHAGRVTSLVDPLGATIHYTYDPRGKLVAATDARGQTVRFRYDERGNPSSVLDPLGGLATTTYDAMRRPVATTDQLGRTTTVERDAVGRVIRRELPTGDVVERRLDPRGLPLDIVVNGRDTIVFERDGAGRPVLVHEPARNRTFTLGWSPGGQLVTLDVDGATMSWDRDRDGLVIARHDPAGRTVRFERDGAGRLTAIAGDRWGSIDLDRDPDGRLVGVRAAGVERRWDYDAGGLVIAYRVRQPAGERSTTLVRDAAGRVVEATDDAGTVRYRYDDAGQLVGASGPAGAWVWHYDPAGRLAREEGPSGVRTFHHDDAHQIVRIDGPDGTTHFAYDDAGRRTGETGPAGARRYSWDGQGRVTGIEVGGRRRDVDVDALGQLAAYDGTPFTWDPTTTVPALVAIGDREVIGEPGLPLGLADPDSTTTWLTADWRGSLSAHGDDHAADPWGASGPGGEAGGGGAPHDAPSLGYVGELDLGGLVWLRNRVYDPASRAFLTPDPVAGFPGQAFAPNPYHYANNDPIGFVDPLGLSGQPLSIEQYNDIRRQETSVQWGNIAMVGLAAASFFIPGGPIVATLVGAAIGAAPGIINGVTTGNWDVGNIVKGAVVGGIAGRIGFAGAGGGSALAAMGRGALTGAAAGGVGEAYDVLPLPGSDGSFDLENVAVSTVLGAGFGRMGYRRTPVGDGPVTFRPPPGATQDEIAQVQNYVAGCNRALRNGDLSPTGRVSTAGQLRAEASRSAAAERARAAAAGTPYQGQAGHVPDTTWTGNPDPPEWMDLTPRVNTSLGGQAAHYPVGYRPTRFEYVDGP